MCTHCFTSLQIHHFVFSPLLVSIFSPCLSLSLFPHVWFNSFDCRFLGDSKVDDGLENIQVDITNIRQRFESGSEERYISSPVPDKSALQRSESLLIRLQRYVYPCLFFSSLLFHLLILTSTILQVNLFIIVSKIWLKFDLSVCLYHWEMLSSLL